MSKVIRLTPRTHYFDCKVSRKAWEKANKARKEPWPNLVEAMFEATAAGVDIGFLTDIAKQAIVVLEGGQKARYGLVAKRLRKALNMVGATAEGVIASSEVLGAPGKKGIL